MDPKAVSPLVGFLPLIIIFGIFYFLLILPQQKKQKAHQVMLQNLRQGDKVVTIGGIFGKIISIRGEVITLEIANQVRVEVVRSGISRRVQG